MGAALWIFPIGQLKEAYFLVQCRSQLRIKKAAETQRCRKRLEKPVTVAVTGFLDQTVSQGFYKKRSGEAEPDESLPSDKKMHIYVRKMRAFRKNQSPGTFGCRGTDLKEHHLFRRQRIAAGEAGHCLFLGERNDRLTDAKRYSLLHRHRQVPVVGGIPVAGISLARPAAMTAEAGNLRSVRQDQRDICPQTVAAELRLTYHSDPCGCNSDLFELYGILTV